MRLLICNTFLLTIMVISDITGDMASETVSASRAYTRGSGGGSIMSSLMYCDPVSSLLSRYRL